jgi:predicted NUDIX family NTP pyrophosphohydrolase
MTKVFPASRLEASERHHDPERGLMTEWKGSGGYFVVAQEAEDYIEATLGERFGVSPFFLMNLTKDPAAWAAVFFTDIIEDSDELLKARAELRDEIGFAAYGTPEPGMRNPPLGAMVVKSAEALNAASSRHEVFRRAWDALQSCAPDKNWVAVVDL